jgi:ribonuclease HII
VVSAAVILPPDLTGDEPWLKFLEDSKTLTRSRRELAAQAVRHHALAVGIGQCSHEEIDEIGIGRASIRAMMRAVADLPVQPGHLLLDYVPIRQCPLPFQAIVKGDSISYSIAAASNVAKVLRDSWMQDADITFPGYSFAQNKGYPTADHRSKLLELGPCTIHRRSFGPVREAVQLWGMT